MVKGLSLEEKKKRMMDFFHESQSFFQLKDIEKICSTEKGITLNTCKTTLDALVDDGVVDTEKIGTSVYFWSLPSKALSTKQKQVNQMQIDMQQAEQKNKQLKEQLDHLVSQQGSQENDEEKRTELLTNISELTETKQRLIAELKAYEANDPSVVHQMRADIAMSKIAVNRWVENIFSLKAWLKNKFRCEEAMLDKQFEIPSELDYIS